MDYTYAPDFKYKNSNPYNDKLVEFSNFVMRDNDSEAFKGRWNSHVFQRAGGLCVEIGTGYGDFMIDYCQRFPKANFIGMDYRFRRSYELARKLSKIENQNFRYLRARGERLRYIFEENEVEQLFYFFPDPWPKKRHFKKRLFQRPFLESAYHVLDKGGKILIKTDHNGYAEWMENEILNISNDQLFNCTLSTRDLYNTHPGHFLTSFQTKFEKIFLSKGTKIKAFVLESKKQLDDRNNPASESQII